MRSRPILPAFLLASAVASLAAAQPTTPLTGRVASADATSKTFIVETPTGDVAFQANDRTVFVRSDELANLSDFKAGDRIRVSSVDSARGRLAARVEALGSGPSPAKTVTGSITSVDVSESRVTIEMPNGSTALRSINTGDPVRIQVAPGALLAGRIDVLSSRPDDAGILGASGSPLRRSLGLWLLAMSATMVALRARRLRLV